MRQPLVPGPVGPRQTGMTLAEVVVVVTLVALVAGLVLPAFKRGFDRIHTRGAAQEVLTAFFTARASAIALGQQSAVVLDARNARVFVVSRRDTLLMRLIGEEHGVVMTSSRDSMSFYPDGLGLGGANLRVIITRGSATDTVIVSREGRAKLGTRAR